MSDLGFDLSWPPKVKCGGAIGLPIHRFLLVLINNIWPNSAHLRDTRLQNLSDLDFDLLGSLKAKCDGVIQLPIYGFL